MTHRELRQVLSRLCPADSPLRIKPTPEGFAIRNQLTQGTINVQYDADSIRFQYSNFGFTLLPFTVRVCDASMATLEQALAPLCTMEETGVEPALFSERI
jgi:hypothetical protein